MSRRVESRHARAPLAPSGSRRPVVSSRRAALRSSKAEERFTDIQRWVDAALPLLRLSQWEVRVSTEPADNDAWADIEAHSQADTATLRLSPDFWKQSSDKRRQILTHELLHLATARMDQVVEGLEDTLGAVAWAVFEPQFENATERVVEHLSRLIAPHLPQVK